MKNPANFLNLIFVVLALTTSACIGQITKSQNQKSASTVENRIVGGGCDGCELMYVGMPKEIKSVDYSPGWTEKGQKLLVTGIVYKLDGQTPSPNVIIYYWQTDNNGYYSPKAEMDERAKRHGHIRGWVKTDVNGKYSIYTIRPATYPNQSGPAHIHIVIKEPNIANEYYIDPFVFDDDKLLIPAKKKRPLENRGGSGILRVLVKDDLQIAEHNIILGLNIPNYPETIKSEKQSGLEIGEDNPSFSPHHVWGPDKGSTVPMSPANWETKDTTKKYEIYLGQPSMFIQSGTALVKNSNFEDGVIEVDVATPNPRVFAGIAFRAQSGEELELVYLRLFKPAFSDAVQYVPRFHNVDAWQLYNAGYTAEANFKKDSWTRLKIQIEGRSARVFVNNAEKPSLLIEDLKRDEGKGLVGLWGLNGAYFANFSYTSRPLPSGLVKPKNGFQPGMIERWDVSQEFSLSDVNFENYPTGNQLDKIKWERLDAEKPGFINFSRYRRKMHIDAVPFKNSDDVVYSRKKIVSSKDQTKKMFFGYSDRIAVFLNGKIIFTGNSAFRSRYDQYLGALGLHDAVYLDLKKGENELLFLVTDKMGGWGMQAQFPDTKGIEF